MEEPSEHDYPRPTVMTSAILKSLAHPIRRRIVKHFARNEFARAADIAAALELPANSVSFHLRTLAAAGLIQEAPDQARDRRDRVWTAVEGGYDLGGPEQPVADEVLGGVVLSGIVEDHRDLLTRFLPWAPEYLAGRSAGVHGTFMHYGLRLTEVEFEAAMEKVGRVLTDAERDHDKTAPDTRYWDVDILAADDTL